MYTMFVAMCACLRCVRCNACMCSLHYNEWTTIRTPSGEFLKHMGIAKSVYVWCGLAEDETFSDDGGRLNESERRDALQG